MIGDLLRFEGNKFAFATNYSHTQVHQKRNGYWSKNYSCYKRMSAVDYLLNQQLITILSYYRAFQKLCFANPLHLWCPVLNIKSKLCESEWTMKNIIDLQTIHSFLNNLSGGIWGDLSLSVSCLSNIFNYKILYIYPC